MHIVVNNLTKRYAGKRGLLGASFSVKQGECLGIVGSNGAGKSTLLKMLSGWIIPDGGHATVAGIPLGRRRELVKSVGFVPETPNLFENFSVAYNFNLFADLFRVSRKRIETIMHDFSLPAFRDTKVQALSKGLKQRVSIGRALLSDPSVIILDEPTSGLDVHMAGEVHQLLKTVNAGGKTILFTSHRPDEVASLATRVLVLEQGEMVFDGHPHESPMLQKREIPA